MKKETTINRREFFTTLAGSVAAVATVAAAQSKDPVTAPSTSPEPTTGTKMTMRKNRRGDDEASLLGFGCMRWPMLPHKDGKKDVYDQETINHLVDAAIAGGVNYFDSSPVYCQGQSERVTGIALSRHPRSSYRIATKLSNFSNPSREASLAMYHRSFKMLQVDTIDYYLLHSIGGGEGMKTLNTRFIDNGMLDFLVAERAAGRIRNLGFSYHGDIAVFDYLLSLDDKIKWDFVQIQLNYIDWKHAKEVNKNNTNAEYLYAELLKRGIPAVIMEPLLGGRLAQLNPELLRLLKQPAPEASAASWAFRFAGSEPRVLTVLSGMAYLEHLEENLKTFSPLVPLTANERNVLEMVAQKFLGYPLIPCNNCQYCMPCPYGLDIPGALLHYNKCLNEGNIVTEKTTGDAYCKARQAFLIGYDRSVPKLRQVERCTGCGQCSSHCPQRIDIPKEMKKIDAYIESLKRVSKKED